MWVHFDRILFKCAICARIRCWYYNI